MKLVSFLIIRAGSSESERAAKEESSTIDLRKKAEASRCSSPEEQQRADAADDCNHNGIDELQIKKRWSPLPPGSLFCHPANHL
jgi:hypothetical protein